MTVLGSILLPLASVAPAQAETLIASLSKDRVLINSNYTGTQIAVFGAIERDAKTIACATDYDVAVTVRGPRQFLTVREKERLGPVWINREQHKLPSLEPGPKLSKSTIAAVANDILKRFGDRASAAAAVREQHGHSATWVKNQPPEIVVCPKTTEDVSEIVKLCAVHRVPVIPSGTGTSLEEYISAPYGGIWVDVSLMTRVIAVHSDHLDCVVEAGVTRKELNEYLRDKGLFFTLDLGADASIGGVVATRALGANAVRYETMKDAVLSLIIVLPNGEIVKTASSAKKSSEGYDLTRVRIESQGTLGVIMEISLKLPGVPVAHIELLEEVQARAVNVHSKLSLPERTLLLLEFHGSEAGVQEQSDRFGEIAAVFGGGQFERATRPEERSGLWQAGHDAYWAANGLRAGAHSVATDVYVPISCLAKCVDPTKRDIQESGLVAPILGHVGDGNFDIQPFMNVDDPAEIAAYEAFIDGLVQRARATEDTCTGGHGDGQRK